MVEHLFYHGISADSHHPSPESARNIRPQHPPDPSRLKVVNSDRSSLRTLAAVLTRIVAMTTIASLLILVLLPAVLAAQAHGL